MLDEVVGDVRALADRQQLLDPRLVEAAVRAWSANTIRAFLSDLRLWDAWCRRSGISAGRANGDTVTGYVRALSGLDRESPAAKLTPTRAPATIARYLVHIGWAYRMADRDDPKAAPLVRLEMKAARKRIGTRQRQARAIRCKGDVADLDGPPSEICLATLLMACRKDMLGAREQALLQVAYDTGCRRSELVAILVDDISPARYRSAGLRFDLRRRNESQARFEARVNELAVIEDEEEDLLVDTADPSRLLGERSISAGSLHLDEWRCSAADLADRNGIAVFPVGGWWKASRDRDRTNGKMRYALILTIDAGDVEQDIWVETAIAAGIEFEQAIEI